jgi:hypothetical protein
VSYSERFPIFGALWFPSLPLYEQSQQPTDASHRFTYFRHCSITLSCWQSNPGHPSSKHKHFIESAFPTKRQAKHGILIPPASRGFTPLTAVCTQGHWQQSSFQWDVGAGSSERDRFRECRIPWRNGAKKRGLVNNSTTTTLQEKQNTSPP